ncbi:response regulator [Telluribacter sp. SYSU D00476]|uniref:response regulator n=1 Tax=Telluribacter sp. SYSU D00476 TaxID=2811430 RepID=UPI001FF5512B|nr:response regulator [Telluribacter sp. SYSU D00476]
MGDTWLLIDDDTDDQFLFSSALHDVNPALRCVTEISGTNALELLQKEEGFTPEVIFLDLNMRGLDGKQCLVRLKTIDRLKEVPIVIYSTSNYPRDISETKELGAAGYIVKPTGFREMVKTIRSLLDSPIRNNSYFFYGR